jgi:hypothetical protein
MKLSFPSLFGTDPHMNIFHDLFVLEERKEVWDLLFAKANLISW